MKFNILFFVLFFFKTALFSQSYFKTEMKKADPVLDNTTISSQEKIKIHKQFLQKAIASKNENHQLYGLFYLISDYHDIYNYVALNDYLLQAENLVASSNNPIWEAALAIRKALALERKDDSKGALEQYKLAYQKSVLAKDSLYMAESLEQMSATYAELYQYDKAEHYFKLALPLLQKFDTDTQLALAYNNYSNLKCWVDDKVSALKYIDLAIDIIHRNNDLYIETMYLDNKAVILTEIKQFEKAEKLLKNNEKIIFKNGWKDRMVQNYLCLALLYEDWGKDKLSLSYYLKHYELKEVINGKNVNTRIANLEVENLKQKKENEIKVSQLELIESKKNIVILILVVSVFVLLLFILLHFWKKQKKNSQKVFNSKLKDLNLITQALIAKNKTLLSEQLIENNNRMVVNESYTIENTFLNQKILTESDWISFKTYFEKAYPNYIKKIRTQFPEITAAEERMFLCLKLNLKTDEVASILGISLDSVKKSRQRLRKKLFLSKEIDLKQYVSNF